MFLTLKSAVAEVVKTEAITEVTDSTKIEEIISQLTAFAGGEGTAEFAEKAIAIYCA